MLEKTNVIMSLHGRFVEDMKACKKRVELRTRTPNLPPGSRVWLYSKMPVAAVTAFTDIVSIETDEPNIIWEKYQKTLSLSSREFLDYTKNKCTVAAIHIGFVYAISPVRLSELRKVRPSFQPPQFFSKLQINDPVLVALDNSALASSPVRSNATAAE